MNFDQFFKRIEYRFEDLIILRQALTHRSHSTQHNERLEFLGDSVLNCAVACELYRKFPHYEEGELSRLRALLVNQSSLATIAEELGIGQSLLLGDGEIKSGGRHRPSILADALEAVIGAVFIDGGYDAARDVVCHIFQNPFSSLKLEHTGKDPKTLLQELLQGRRLPLPQYDVVAVLGEAHQQRFEVACVIPGLNIRCIGAGTSRRRAEQEAARLAYEHATAA